MKKTVSLSSSRPLRPAKLLAVFAVFCLLINGLVPRYGTKAIGYDVFAQFMGAHAPLMELFSLSALPIKLVGQLMKDAAGAPPGKMPGNNKEGTSSEASTDISIVSGETQRGLSRCSGGTPGGGAAVISVNAGFRHGALMNRTPLRTSGSPPGGLSLILLLLFFLLPRSGIDDNAMMPLIRHFSARFAPAIRVFICRGGAL